MGKSMMLITNMPLQIFSETCRLFTHQEYVVPKSIPIIVSPLSAFLSPAFLSSAKITAAKSAKTTANFIVVVSILDENKCSRRYKIRRNEKRRTSTITQ
uniref:Uncharacterized protein n=1 Tax=Romanomermis culicivorax TaxID=13658 RepID=A0A915K4S4_ROMCU